MIGGATVQVQFQGGGDSGEILDADLFDKEGKRRELSDTKILWTVEKDKFVNNEWITEAVEEFMPVKEVLRHVTETMLENEGLDWYNNDGGQGELVIDLTEEPPSVVLKIGINYMHTDDHEFDYTDTVEKEEEM
jgi:hypothetical protein